VYYKGASCIVNSLNKKAISLSNLDIVLPIYNPLDNWDSDVIRQYKILLERLPENIQTHLILVNDGSSFDLSDGWENINKVLPDAEWISYTENRGKGYALRQGVKKCKGDFIMYTDYDFPYTYGSMVRMIEKMINSNVDAILGTRDQSYYAHISGRRKWISQNLKKVNRLLFRLPTDDTQCGLKAFNQKAKDIFMTTTTDRYLIDVEFLKKLVKNNASVDTQNVVLRDNVVLSKISNLRLIKEMFNYLKIMLS